MSNESGVDPAGRLGIDEIVDLLQDSRFAARHRRRLSLRETSQHVNPLMLAGATAESIYVNEWRKHAGHCPACAKLFSYFGLG